MENKYYQFFYRLWNILLAFVYFILFNLPLILNQFLFKYHSPVMMIFVTSLLSITLIPSYSSSLRMVVKNEVSLKKYIAYFKENWSPSYKISVLLSFIFLITRLNMRYFADTNIGLSFFFDVIGWLILVLFLNIAALNTRFEFKLNEYFILSILYFKRFFKSSFVILLLSASAIRFLPLKYCFTLMIIFPLHVLLTRDDLDHIQNEHTG